MNLQALQIPSSDAAIFAALPADEKIRVRTLLKLFDQAARAERPRRVLIEWVNNGADGLALSLKRVETMFYDLMNKGRNWTALVNKAKAPRAMGAGLSEAFTEYWQTLIEQNQRKSKPAYREFVRRFRAGENIPGIGTWARVFADQHPGAELPASCPPHLLPRGCGYGNLMARYKSDAHALALTRIGKSASANFRPLALGTRKGLAVGEVYMFDDLWFDVKVNFLGAKPEAAFRPVGLDALDLASGSLFSNLILRVTRDDDGAKQMIKKKHALFFVAHVLTSFGYRPEGTTLVLEHATMALPEHLDAPLHDWTDGAVHVQRGKIDAEPVVRGLFRSTGGNPRMKAALESMRNLLHNELAMLPGQQGRNRDNEPDGQYGREQYNAQLVRALGEIYRVNPGLAMTCQKLLKLPYIAYDEFVSFAMEIYNRVNLRTDHDLEGWEACGNFVQEFVPAPGAAGKSVEEILALPPEQGEPLLAMMRAFPNDYTRSRRMSPHEVFQRSAPRLARFNPIHVPEILGEDNGVERTLGRNFEFEFTDEFFGSDAVTFSGELQRVDGGREMLRAGETYMTFLLPAFSATGDSRRDVMIVCRAGSLRGSVLGFVRRKVAVRRTDLEAFEAQAAEIARTRALLEGPVKARHAHEGAMQEAAREHNAAVLEGAQSLIAAGSKPAPVADATNGW